MSGPSPTIERPPMDDRARHDRTAAPPRGAAGGTRGRLRARRPAATARFERADRRGRGRDAARGRARPDHRAGGRLGLGGRRRRHPDAAWSRRRAARSRPSVLPRRRSRTVPRSPTAFSRSRALRARPAVAGRGRLAEVADDPRDLPLLGALPVPEALPGEEVATAERAKRHLLHDRRERRSGRSASVGHTPDAMPRGKGPPNRRRPATGRANVTRASPRSAARPSSGSPRASGDAGLLPPAGRRRAPRRRRRRAASA